jgi:hypothetical protein
MVQQIFAERKSRGAVRVDVKAAPMAALRLVGALLALAVAAAHVADQGGVTAFTSPGWLGWSYRLIEVGGVATAIALILPRPARLGWLAGLLLGVGPFLGFMASRTIGVPGDAADVGNWSDWVGTIALVVEAALVVLAVGVLLGDRHRSSSSTRGSGDVGGSTARLGWVRARQRRTDVTPVPILK